MVKLYLKFRSNEYLLWFIINKEKIMVEVTQAAQDQVAEYFNGKEIKPVRIFLNEGG